jgi:acetoin utilization protein AcuB
MMSLHIRFKLPVEEYTTCNPVTASETADVNEIELIMRVNGVRHLPIVRGTDVVGIISERDMKLVRGLPRVQQSLLKANDIMHKDPYCCSSNTPLDEVAFEMSESKIGSAIVLDDEGKLMGIFTLTDALNALIEIIRGEEPEELEESL